jgi:hypothetical protein
LVRRLDTLIKKYWKRLKRNMARRRYLNDQNIYEKKMFSLLIIRKMKIKNISVHVPE